MEPLCHPLDHSTCSVVEHYVTQRLNSPVGPVFHATPIMVTKSGRMLRMISRYQYFFTHGGQVCSID